MAGLADVLRLLIEKSWTLGVLLLVTAGGASILSRHGQHVPALVDEWAPLAALLGLALIVLSAIGAMSAKMSADRATRRVKYDAAEDAVANLATLDVGELAALAELLDAGAPRISISHGSIMADIWRKGILVQKRQENALQSICEVHPSVLELKEEIIAQWRTNVREGRTSSLIDHNPS